MTFTGNSENPNFEGAMRTVARPGDNPNVQSAIGTLPNGIIRLQEARSPMRSQLFGNLPDEMTAEEFKNFLATATYAQRKALKVAMFNAGYYTRLQFAPEGKGALENLSTRSEGLLGAAQVESGSWYNADNDALDLLLQDVIASKDKTVDQILQERRAEASVITGKYIEETFDSQSIADDLQAMALKNLNRELSDQELDRIMGLVFSPNSLSEEGGLVQFDYGGQRIITGGGPNSSSIAFGHELAKSYGLTVSESFQAVPEAYGVPSDLANAYREGRGITFSGDAQQLTRFYDWISSQKDLVEKVKADQTVGPDGKQTVRVRVAFKDEAVIPSYFENINPAQQPLTQKQQFVEALRTFNSVDDFDWAASQDPLHRGAYGLSQQLWDYYTQQLGLDPNDTSIVNQNRVIEAHVDVLYDKYNGNFEDMAIAMAGTEGMADAIIYNRSLAPNANTDPYGEDPTVRKARQIVAEMGKRKMPLDIKAVNQSLFNKPAYDWRATEMGGIPTTFEQGKAKAYRIFNQAMKSNMNVAAVYEAVEKEVKESAFDPTVLAYRQKGNF